MPAASISCTSRSASWSCIRARKRSSTVASGWLSPHAIIMACLLRAAPRMNERGVNRSEGTWQRASMIRRSAIRVGSAAARALAPRQDALAGGDQVADGAQLADVRIEALHADVEFLAEARHHQDQAERVEAEPAQRDGGL